MGIARVSQLEHELGFLPCSDSECYECTGIRRTVSYDPRLDSYTVSTYNRNTNLAVSHSFAREIFEKQLMLVSRKESNYAV